jgi:endonuclease/exonuclease/phosphatase family metal-dependent hydrolase
LSCNIQAGSSTRAYRDYLTRSWSHVLPSSGKRANLDALAALFTPFDVVGLQESDPGSLRSGFNRQSDTLAEAGRFPFVSHQSNRKIGRIAGSGNALLSRVEPLEILDYPLPGRVAGRGVLLARFGEGAASWRLGITHLSLGMRSRRMQLGFLADLLADDRRLVLMGDFNCPAGAPEMHLLYRRTRLAEPVNGPLSFPSWAPDRALDHILVAGFRVEDYVALAAAGSDHLAIAISLH